MSTHNARKVKIINARKVKIITRHRAGTEHSLTFRVRTMLSYREVEASLLVGWLVGWEFNVHFQHKYGYITDEGKTVTTVRVMLP